LVSEDTDPMPVTIAAIKTMLDMNGIHYSDVGRPDEIGMGWESARYVDPDTGRKSVAILIRLEESGRYIKIFAPACFSVAGVAHKAAMLEALLGVCWRTKLLQFELDESDGEIRAMVEWPIEDGTVTFAQLSRSIRAIVYLLDQYSEIIVKAGRTGVISWTDESDAKRALGMALLRELFGR
jgi:hypothetical protein